MCMTCSFFSSPSVLLHHVNSTKMKTFPFVLCGGRGLGKRPKLTAVVLLALCSSLLLFLYSSAIIRTTDNAPWQPFHFLANLTSRKVTITTTSTTSPPALHNVTVVTGFLDIGEFGKGNPSNKRDWHIYQHWASAYSQLRAPVVMYTNSDAFARHFISLRQHLQQWTMVRRLALSSLWSFSLKPRIAAIYSRGYPKHWPNTVYPEYTCVTHAKFDLLRDVLDQKFFDSRHVAWMDIGYLRNIVGKNDTYIMQPPSHFDPQKVLCGEVFSPNFNQSWKSILRNNVNWVAGGFFLARRDVMSAFVDQYQRAVTTFLRHHESQVEQHILYATYTKEGRSLVHPTVELQAPHGGWFDVGFSCLHILNTSTTHSAPLPTTPHSTTHSTNHSLPSKKAVWY